MLFVGNQAQAAIQEKLKNFKHIQQIQTQGVQTISELQKLMEGNIHKAVVIWNLHKLQKQYLPSLFLLVQKYSEIYDQTSFFLHSEVFLPLQTTGKYHNIEKPISSNKTFLTLLKEKNLSGLENLSLDTTEYSAKEYLECLLQTIFNALQKPNCNPILFNLFTSIHKIIAFTQNNMLTSKQALSLAIDQLKEVELVN